MADIFSSLSALGIFLIITIIGFALLLVSFIAGDWFEGLDLDGAIDTGPGFMDFRAISVFITAFGGFGAIGTMAGLTPFSSSMLGILGGVILGGVVTIFGRFLYRQQASSSVSSSSLIGRTAQVIVSIPQGGVGQISCRVGEERVERLARSRSDSPLSVGSIVRIEEITGDAVIVAPQANNQLISAVDSK
jgi:membrane protein implicated in regulation of membrane protease activity